ncbi:hypothetical protein ACNFBR_05830 [Pseudomonas sp. NY11955]|uniref:hypothetical protein n=1 Tax=Pseudomonas sp. NY11955 TaxID=3400363 RepID=UPI003A86E560
MNEEILNMSGDIASDMAAYQAAQPANQELAVATVLECETLGGCTSMLCVAA